MAEEINPPFSPPDCPWRLMEGKIPDNVASNFGELNGEPSYIGRVRDGNIFYIGTVVPSKGVCRYLTKKGELKERSNFEILTIDCGNPLEFRSMDFDSGLQFVAGSDGDEIFYPSRVVDGTNSYIGWVSRDSKICHIPRESANKVTEKFDVLVHSFLDRLCVCPMPPPHCL